MQQFYDAINVILLLFLLGKMDINTEIVKEPRGMIRIIQLVKL